MAYGQRDELKKTKTKLYSTNSSGYIATEFVNAFSPVTRLGNWQFINPLPVKGQRYIPGQFRVNPVTIRRYSASCAKISFHIPFIRNWGEGYLFDGDLSANIALPQTGISGSITGSTNSAATNRCLVRCYSNMASPSHDVGVMLAEAGETLKLLANPLGAVRKQVTKLLSRAIRPSKGPIKRRLSGKEFLENTSNQWLEYRYGIMPAISDANMLMDLFGYKVTKVVSNLLRISASEEKPSSRTERQIIFYPTAYLTGTAVQRTDTSLRTTCTLYYKDTAQQPRLGLSIMDIPNLAWELVPFSFCVDWVFNVGDWLRSHYVPPSLQPLGCSVSHKERVLDVTTPLTIKHNWYSKVYQFPFTPYIQKRETLVRELITSPPALPPVSRTIMNFNRTLDSLSLTWKPLTEAFRKLR